MIIIDGLYNDACPVMAWRRSAQCKKLIMWLCCAVVCLSVTYNDRLCPVLRSVLHAISKHMIGFCHSPFVD
jgi:hypothetical protein